MFCVQKLLQNGKFTSKGELLIPICSYCLRIRDYEGKWISIDEKSLDHIPYKYTHTVCQECVKIHYSDFN